MITTAEQVYILAKNIYNPTYKAKPSRHGLIDNTITFGNLCLVIYSDEWLTPPTEVPEIQIHVRTLNRSYIANRTVNLPSESSEVARILCELMSEMGVRHDN